MREHDTSDRWGRGVIGLGIAAALGLAAVAVGLRIGAQDDERTVAVQATAADDQALTAGPAGITTRTFLPDPLPTTVDQGGLTTTSTSTTTPPDLGARVKHHNRPER